ncbi:hypothetical protein JXJ21_06325 [candidate division KSB1 bacterium]|nr:hypothetical protein [candidate division KSB1 bacterium]
MKHFIVFTSLVIALLSCLRCKEEKLIQKVDPVLRIELQDLEQRKQLDTPLLVLIKANEDFTDVHRAILKKYDVTLHASIAHIHTASMPASSIYKITRFRFIEYIEASKDLMRKQLLTPVPANGK